MDVFVLERLGVQGRDKPSPYDGVCERNELDGEMGVKIAMQGLANPVEDVLQAPFSGFLHYVLPVHFCSIFTEQLLDICVDVKMGREDAVVEEV